MSDGQAATRDVASEKGNDVNSGPAGVSRYEDGTVGFGYLAFTTVGDLVAALAQLPPDAEMGQVYPAFFSADRDEDEYIIFGNGMKVRDLIAVLNDLDQATYIDDLYADYSNRGGPWWPIAP